MDGKIVAKMRNLQNTDLVILRMGFRSFFLGLQFEPFIIASLAKIKIMTGGAIEPVAPNRFGLTVVTGNILMAYILIVAQSKKLP